MGGSIIDNQLSTEQRQRRDRDPNGVPSVQSWDVAHFVDSFSAEPHAVLIHRREPRVDRSWLIRALLLLADCDARWIPGSAGCLPRAANTNRDGRTAHPTNRSLTSRRHKTRSSGIQRNAIASSFGAFQMRTSRGSCRSDRARGRIARVFAYVVLGVSLIAETSQKAWRTKTDLGRSRSPYPDSESVSRASDDRGDSDAAKNVPDWHMSVTPLTCGPSA
jgi:hypothetical protein